MTEMISTNDGSWIVLVHRYFFGICKCYWTYNIIKVPSLPLSPPPPSFHPEVLLMPFIVIMRKSSHIVIFVFFLICAQNWHVYLQKLNPFITWDGLCNIGIDWSKNESVVRINNQLHADNMFSSQMGIEADLKSFFGMINFILRLCR